MTASHARRNPRNDGASVVVPHVDDVRRHDDGDGRRSRRQHGNGDELRGAGEHEHRHAEHLRHREPRLYGEAAEHRAVDEDGRYQRE